MKKKVPKLLPYIFPLSVAWIFLAGFLILQSLPDLPKTNLGWFLLVVVGPPIYVAGEVFFGWFLSDEHGRKISNKQFSLLRMALLFFVFGTLFGLSVIISSHLN